MSVLTNIEDKVHSAANAVEDWIFGGKSSHQTAAHNDAASTTAVPSAGEQGGSLDAARDGAYGPKTGVTTATAAAADTTGAAKPHDQSSGFFSAVGDVFDWVFGDDQNSTAAPAEVRGKTDANGQVGEVTATTDRGTTTQDADHNLKFVGKDGDTVQRSANGDVDSQNGDGTKQYHRDGQSGQQHYEDHSKGITADYNPQQATETAPDGSTHGQVRVGNITGSWHEKNGRRWFQSDTPLQDVKPEDLQEGVTYAFSDKDTGDKMIAFRRNGVVTKVSPDSAEFDFANGSRVVRDNHGNLTYFDDKHADGMRVTRENFDQLKGSLPEFVRQRFQRYQDHFVIGGNHVGAHGSIQTDQGDSVTQQPDKVTLTTANGDTTVTAGPGGVTTVECRDGFKSVQQNHVDTITDERNGHVDQPLFTYNFQNGNLIVGDPDHPDIDFSPESTTFGWNGMTVDNDGSIQFDDGSNLCDTSSAAYVASAGLAQSAVQEAGAAAIAVSNELSSGTVYDTGRLDATLAELSTALSQCLAAGNLEAAGMIIAARGQLDALIAPARKKSAEARELRELGFGAFSIAGAEKNDYGFTADGLVDKMLRERETAA
ncbi:MAG TPA: hypothetical protein V6C69_21365 [Trichormus sp.]